MFDSNIISRLTTEGGAEVAWLCSMESRMQTARQSGHWGLWLDKFSYAWSERVEAGTALLERRRSEAKNAGNREVEKRIKTDLDKIPSGKAAALSVACDLLQRSKSELDKAIKARQDWLKRLEAQHGTARLRTVRLYSTSPLILHLGRANVLENVGFYCERTTGLPLIPGTAVKGVLSTWACWGANQNDDGSFPDPESWVVQRSADPADHARRIFGSDAESGSESAGEVTFLGACPSAVPTLALDIVNPHHDEKNVGGSIVRKDKERLTPSVFLCLEAGTAWDFTFIVRAGTPDAADILSTTETWLRECLAQVGLGAKTAAGYGRFSDKPVPPSNPSTSSTKTEAERQADAAAHSAALEILQSDYPNKATFKNRVLDKLNNPSQLPQLEKEVPLLKKPENHKQLDALKERLKAPCAKSLRKTLKEKTWFPPEWLPPQP
jgi:CRISPR type III-B/RAMP module RAMP protein Cmr6